MAAANSESTNVPRYGLANTAQRRRCLRSLTVEQLESRRVLSAGLSQFVPGELLIGFEGEVARQFDANAAERAIETANTFVGIEGLYAGRVLQHVPGRAAQAERVTTHWRLPESADVLAIASRIEQLRGVAYAEPNYIYSALSNPSDPGFTGTWEHGLQEHLAQVGAPAAWDVTNGVPEVIVAVIDSGVDLDHPDLDGNLIAGTSFVAGSSGPQDDYGHGTHVAGIIAAEMDNLADLASEANGDTTWAGGTVGVAPNVGIMPIKVLDSEGYGDVSDIAAGINFAVDPDGDPNTDDGADIINLSLGGGFFSQAVADAIWNAYSHNVLVVAGVGPSDSGVGYPASDPYALGVAAVNPEDVWDDISRHDIVVDVAAPGVEILSTFIDRDDDAEGGFHTGAYGRIGGTSVSTPIVSGTAALIKSLHPEWGPDEIAGQLLATAGPIDSINVGYEGQLGAGRVNASAAVGPTSSPRIISVTGLGAIDSQSPTRSQLQIGDTIDLQFSHAMDETNVLMPTNYQLEFLGDPEDPSDNQTVDLVVVTQPFDPNATEVTDLDNMYISFPGRGVQLQVNGIAGGSGTILPIGLYRLTVAAMPSIGGGMSTPFTHQFQTMPRVRFGDPQVLAESQVIQPFSVYAVDLDGDSDVDMLSASPGDNKIAWYENVDGAGNVRPQHVITTDAVAAFSVFAADLDGDGDQDVLSASAFDNKIAWYENTDGAGIFGRQLVITETAQWAQAVFATDLDGDGDVDVLSASGVDDKIAWYENTDGTGTFGPQRVITTEADDARSVFAADLDGDGDIDVLSASRNDNKIAWYENTDGDGSFGPQRVITTNAADAFSVFATDLDGDGDADVLSASPDDDKIAWYENTDGEGTFGPQLVITTDVVAPLSVFAADIDNDGDMDVLSASAGDNMIAWYANTDGTGGFGPQQVITTSAVVAFCVFATDLDGDGDQDVLSASRWDNKIAWYENQNGVGTFGPQNLASLIGAVTAESVATADLDDDGDLDVLSASWGDDKIAWYENLDGAGTFGRQNVITQTADGAQSVVAADLDDDGDLDIVSASTEDDKIAWYENTDGTGTFGPQRVITTDADHALSVFSTDMDGDGDVDLVSASGNFDGKVAWYENTDGAGTFGAQRVITTSVSLPP